MSVESMEQSRGRGGLGRGRQRVPPTSLVILLRAVREGTLQRCRQRPGYTSQGGSERLRVTGDGGGSEKQALN